MARLSGFNMETDDLYELIALSRTWWSMAWGEGGLAFTSLLYLVSFFFRQFLSSIRQSYHGQTDFIISL